MVPNNPKVVDAPLIPFERARGRGQEDDRRGQGAERGLVDTEPAVPPGPNLPTLKYKMPDSHFICFPYETRVPASTCAGCVRRPMRVTQAQTDATGAVP